MKTSRKQKPHFIFVLILATFCSLAVNSVQSSDPDGNSKAFLAGKDPSMIPELIKMLDDDNSYITVQGAAERLSSFGSAAKSAAPKLLSIYTNHVVGPDRQSAQSWGVPLMQALKAIDMEAAAKAEVFLVNSGPLNYARHSYTTTLLPNGKELIVGGYVHTEIPTGSNRFLSNAELNDPATGRWTPTGRLNTSRDSHTATLLANGKVLVAGGSDGTGAVLDSAELYDPTTGKWTPTGRLNTARHSHTAALQPDGTVMVAGGHDGRDRLSNTEVYDPASGTWKTGQAVTALLPAARRGHTATLLRNGNILVVGGGSISSSWLSSAELYNPVAGTWTNTGVLNTTRMGHEATLLPNGKVLVVAGNGNGVYLSSAELYDPATGTWKNAGILTPGRISATATLLYNGKVLVVGGEGDHEKALASAEQFDPATGKWTETGAMSNARYSPTATLLPNGKVLVAGGKDSVFNVLSSAELYDPATGKWTETGKLTTQRWRHTATLLSNGKVLVAGGSDSGMDRLSSAELYDPATGKWTATGELNTKRYDHTATLLHDGQVLVTGSDEGGYFEGVVAFGAELYNPATGKWTVSRALSADRYGHTATLLPNGKVLIVGGDAVNPTELYDPATGK
jgi:N-acetylneuraminic acid mutarotase